MIRYLGSSLASPTPPLLTKAIRTFSGTHSLKKDTPKTYDANDREKLNPQRNEVAKSGTDDEVAHHPSAYDPSQTAPEAESASTDQESRQKHKVANPLNVSPANRDVSAGTRPAEKGAQRNIPKDEPSGRGQTKKNRRVHQPHGTGQRS